MNADDYKIEADKYLDLALTCRNGYEHLTNADVIAIAQVNATLHLANQQRIANLLAWQALHRTLSGPLVRHVEDEIEKGLGL